MALPDHAWIAMVITPQNHGQIPEPKFGFESSYCQQHCQHHSSAWVLCNHKETTADPEKSKLGIYTVATSPFMR
jgi:hypothetical protein